MKKKLLTVITAFIMALTASMPCCCAVEQPKAADTQPQIVQKKHKEDRNEAKNVLTKFLITMLWVGGSCLVIFLILYAYKNLKKSNIVNHGQIDIAKNLNSPESIEDATKFFIEKF